MKPLTLPEDLKTLELYCYRHRYPLMLAFLSVARSPQGQPMAVYGCHCRYREGWGLHPLTAHPQRIWTGWSHQGR
jgi:hypothetical protein